MTSIVYESIKTISSPLVLWFNQVVTTAMGNTLSEVAFVVMAALLGWGFKKQMEGGIVTWIAMSVFAYLAFKGLGFGI